jgi:nucleoside-diphosphate-sugar epimerase
VRVLLTGATGFIGLNLAEKLLARGHRVRALVRASSRTGGLESLGVELARGDVTRPDALPAAVDGCDLVIHLAGLVKAIGREEYFRVNALGTRGLAKACAGARPRPRLVLLSSLAAAGPAAPGRPRREEDPPAPVSLYGESKLAAEREVQALAGRVEAVIVRPPIVYGPGDKELLPALFRMARLGVVLKAGLGDKRYSLIHVEDLCDAILAAAERGKPVGLEGHEGTYFVSDGAEHAWEDVARAALDALGARGRVVAVPEAVSWLLAAGSTVASGLTGVPAMLSFDKMNEIRQAAWTCAVDRARRELGFAPRYALAEGMRQSADWFRARGLVR